GDGQCLHEPAWRALPAGCRQMAASKDRRTHRSWTNTASPGRNERPGESELALAFLTPGELAGRNRCSRREDSAGRAPALSEDQAALLAVIAPSFPASVQRTSGEEEKKLNLAVEDEVR